MKILILKKERIITTTLPNTIYGDFQIVDVDENGNQIDLITIKEKNGKWLLTNTMDTAIIVNNTPVGSINLTDYFSCEILYRKSDYKYILYCLPTFDKTTLYNVKDASITIGPNNSDINYRNGYLISYGVRIYYDNAWYIEVLNDTYLVYLNNKSIKKERLYNGDVIFILGLRIVVLGNYMIINNPYNTVSINGNKLNSVMLSNFINKNLSKNLVFIIGGSYGLSDDVMKRANYCISFSDLTFPHQLFRIILLEQIYRSFKIINNESYHK